MWLYKLACVFILATVSANAESYYESHNSTTWMNVPCTLAEQQLKYHNGFFEVNDKFLTSDDVWLGYVYAKVTFLLLGCASLQSENGVYVKEIGDCFTICSGEKIGVKRTSKGQTELVCTCVSRYFDTTEPTCKGGDRNSLCNNCSEVYTQINVNASNVYAPGNKPEGDCLTYYYPHFTWQSCSRSDYIHTMCSNAAYTDPTATATIDGTTSAEWSAANKLCLTNGRHPSFERSITNTGFGLAQGQYYWTGIFRANILMKLSLKDLFSRFSTVSYVYANRNSTILVVANNDDKKRALCVTETKSTPRHPETPTYITEVKPSVTISTYSETSVFITKVTTLGVTTTDGTTQMYTTLATDYALLTCPGRIIEERRHANSDKSPALGLGIGVSLGILFLVGGAVVIVVLKRRRVLPCWMLKTTEGQSRRRFEESQDTNYEGMIDRNQSNENYCVLGRNVDSDEGPVSYINAQSDLNSKEDKCNSEYYNMGSYENVQNARAESDPKNK